MSIPDSPRWSNPSRRELIVLGVGAFAVAALPAVRRPAPRLVRRSVPLMGTLAEIGVVHRDPRYAHAAIDAALEELRWVEQTMSRFTERSDVGRVNARAARGAVRVTPETLEVLAAAIGWAEASDGAFDPCLGKVAALWDVAHRRTPPPPTAYARLAGRRLYRAVDLDTHAGGAAVRFTDPDVALDLGGIAKGYGVDRATHALRRWGITRALVNVGGDLAALGDSEDGDPWLVGVRSPDAPDRLAATLQLSDGAVATSGDYLQYFTHRGRRYHHLLDPGTAAPRLSAARSVTVAADCCMTADAAATAIFGMQLDAAHRLLAARAPNAEVAHRI